jgi:hypothetical protein
MDLMWQYSRGNNASFNVVIIATACRVAMVRPAERVVRFVTADKGATALRKERRSQTKKEILDFKLF